MFTDERAEQFGATRARYAKRTPMRLRNIRLIEDGKTFQADSRDRIELFLKRRSIRPEEVDGIFSADAAMPRTLERIFGRDDLIGFAFLEQGLAAARAVGRIVLSNLVGRHSAYGTGFLVSPCLLLTNHHVLPSESVAARACVEFDHHIALDGSIPVPARFGLDPKRFFVSSRRLDYALVAIDPWSPQGRELEEFGWIPLIEAQGKAIIGSCVNIIQHPGGQPKQVCLRNNLLVDLLENHLHYQTDTAPGSSGAPVLNDRWEVVALHHSGVHEMNEDGEPLTIDGRVWQPHMGDDNVKWIANEGVRVSRIVHDLQRQSMTAVQRALFEQSAEAPVPGVPRRGRVGDMDAHDVSGTIVRCGPAEGVGEASWTIPLKVSVSIPSATARDTFAGQAVKSLIRPEPTPDSEQHRSLPEEPGDSVLEEARRKLGSRHGIVGVRDGYIFRQGWITDEKAVVVIVHRTSSDAQLAEEIAASIPSEISGRPVQVTSPTIQELLELEGYATAAQEAFGADNLTAEEIRYEPPPNARLQWVTAPMRVTAFTSPDAGWPTFKRFLENTRRTLTVGIYDIGAPHVVDLLKRIGNRTGFDRLTIALQRGSNVGEGTKADDLTDRQTIDRLSAALGQRLNFAWVRVGTTDGWVAYSYHIKVAVRDDREFWLSSGNLQSSNMPALDPLGADGADPAWLKKYNREWHVIVDHAGLARTFSDHLMHDYRSNRTRESLAVPADYPTLWAPEEAVAPDALEADLSMYYFYPFSERRRFSVIPLLTPDNYHEQVLELIRGAEEELFIQNQTFNAPKPNHRDLAEIIDAVIERQRAGVDVRVIFRLFFASDARANLESLKRRGFDMEAIRVQKNCHTKGIIADRQLVLIGSHNLSNAGVSTNRDASLLFNDASLAEHFRELFVHDWNTMAARNIGAPQAPLELSESDLAPRPGLIAVPWTHVMEMA